MSRALRTVVVLKGDPPAEWLDALLVDTSDYDVVYVDSIANGYARIRQVTPDLVIVHSEITDAAACQLLSILKIDEDVSHIPVVTCVMHAEDTAPDDDLARLDPGSVSQVLSVPMN